MATRPTGGRPGRWQHAFVKGGAQLYVAIIMAVVVSAAADPPTTSRDQLFLACELLALFAVPIGVLVFVGLRSK
jgi:hypothetical protein